MDDACRAEVLRIHEFFQRWLNGNTIKSEDYDSDITLFEKECDCALARDMILIKPSGNIIGYDELKRELLEAHDTQTAFHMNIFNMKVLQPFLLIYEEWHYHGDTRTDTRQCTALFRPNPKAPCGVEWVHIHETCIQEQNH
jgi:hypothetical protein